MRQSNASAQGASKASSEAPFGAMLGSMAALPETLERNPNGAAIFAGLFVFALVCWVVVTWIKHRRR